MKLPDLGWDSWFEEKFAQWCEEGLVPGRVVSEAGPGFEVECEHGTMLSETSGKLRHTAESRGELPAVGDWVALQPLVAGKRGVIHGVLPRRTAFSRKEAGKRAEEQVLVANVDTVFVVAALEGYRSFSLPKLERYLVVGRSSGAEAVIVLNKIDLCPEYQVHVDEVRGIAPDLAILAVSATERIGLEAFEPRLGAGRTGVFLGPSGVGKSALINALSGEDRQDTGEIRAADGKGRHTTTRRQLVVLPGGGLVIDTPGLRELAMWSAEEGLGSVFEDVERLFAECRFRDCRHENEPGCAVKRALENGSLDPARWQSYRKLLKETAFIRRRHDVKEKLAHKKKWKRISQWSKALKKGRGRP